MKTAMRTAIRVNYNARTRDVIIVPGHGRYTVRDSWPYGVVCIGERGQVQTFSYSGLWNMGATFADAADWSDACDYPNG